MSNELKAEKYPLDFDKIEKGDVLNPDLLEDLVGVDRTHYHYSIKCYALGQRIERELAGRGVIVCCRTRKMHLEVMPDHTNSITQGKRLRHSLKKLFKAHWCLMTVDRLQLTEDERESHERRVEISSKYVQAMSGVKEGIKLLPYTRPVPLGGKKHGTGSRKNQGDRPIAAGESPDG